MAEKRSDLFWASLMAAIFLAVIAIAGYFLFTGSAFVGPSLDQNTQATDQVADWNIATNSALGFELKYPNNFFDAGHEPKIIASACSYDNMLTLCTDLNQQKMTINNVDYCYHRVSDAATGQVYYYDYYTTAKNKTCMTVQLDTATQNCDFYLPLEQGNTEQKTNYDNCIAKNEEQPKTLSQIINTFKFTPTP